MARDVAELRKNARQIKIDARPQSRGASAFIKLVMLRSVAVPVMMLAVSVQVVPSRAQTSIPPTSPTVDCPFPESQPLVMPPEFVSKDGILRGTIILTEEDQRLPESANGVVTCAPQLLRVFRGEGLPAAAPAEKPDPNLHDPIPGPTLRARVGDLVQLTFQNRINSNRFDENLDIEACTEVGKDGEIYPLGGGGGKPRFQDKFPNCLHASSTANIHFHGTHTNPNATGDNVYLQIRPLPRDNQGNLTTTPEQATVGFEEFFKNCTERLQNPLNTWPMTWADLPKSWTDKQAELLIAYQQKNPRQRLWDENQKVLHESWPIYYIGAFPYCFALPAYTDHAGTRPVMGQIPGTHWYHAHKHGSTAINVANGMTGAFIIEGQYDDDLNDPNSGYGRYILRDGNAWNTRSQKVLVLNQLGTVPNAIALNPAFAPTGVDFSVNGRLRPTLQMQPGEIQLWRILNTSGRTAAYFMPPKDLQWRQLAQDGVQFSDVNYQESLNKPFYMAPANRVDLLVKAPMQPTSAEIRIQNVMSRRDVTLAPPDITPEPGTVLLKVEVAGPPVIRDDQPTEMAFLAQAPKQPEFLADITDEELKQSNYITRTLEFNSKPPGSEHQHTINDIQFSDGHANLKILLGSVEEWKVVNKTTNNIDHPLHIHINPFQVTEVFDPNETFLNSATGQRLPRYVTDKNALVDPARQCLLDLNDQTTWHPCRKDKTDKFVWWDVFPMPAARTESDKVIPGYFKMRSRFVDYPGVYVLHCHILIHEDRGMMFSVEVLKTKSSPVRHH